MSTASTAAGSAGGVNLYETPTAVHEYLQFHFGTDSEILPYECGAHDALHFPARCADACLAAKERGRALDIGCAVGGQAFALSEHFAEVVGIDFSQMFIDAANQMKLNGTAKYTARIEGDIFEQRSCKLGANARPDRTFFAQGDACALKSANEIGAKHGGGLFDAILASNLLCRLPDPEKFLQSLPGLMKEGGVVVLVSPYSWLEAWTPKDKWLGGYTDTATAQARTSFLAVKAIMELGFDLEKEEDVPFLIREHQRKFQYGVSHLSIWRRFPAKDGVAE